MRIHVGERIAVEMIDRKKFGFSTARIVGEFTDQDPARLVFLHRHADMADDTSDLDARSDVERGADRLANILASAVSSGIPSDLSAAVEEANTALREGGTYYSVLLAIVARTWVVAAGIGNVTVQLWTSDGSQSLLSPTMTIVGKTPVLSNALGLGFQRDGIQKTNISLSAGDRLIIGADVEVDDVPPTPTTDSPVKILQNILDRKGSRGTGIVGVISAAA